MEIGNAAADMWNSISQLPRPHLRKIAGRLRYFAGPEDRQLYSKSETDLNELGNGHSHRLNSPRSAVGVPSIIYFAVQLREQTRERRQEASECPH